MITCITDAAQFSNQEPNNIPFISITVLYILTKHCYHYQNALFMKTKNIHSHWQVVLKMQNTGTELNITWHQFHELHGKEWRWFVLLLVPAVLLPATLTTQNKHQQLSGYIAVVKTTALAFSQHTSIGRDTHIQSHGTHTPSTRVLQEWWWLWTTDRNTLTEAGRTTCILMDRVYQDNISTVSQNTHSQLELV